MKRLTTSLCFLTVSTCLIFGQSHNEKRKVLIETELVPILTREVGLHFSYSFAEKWSVYAGGSLWLGNICHNMSPTEEFHYGELVEKTNKQLIYDFYNSELAVQFWPDDAFKGHFMSAGVRYGNSSKTDFILEYGYRIPISKGFGISFSIKTGLLSIIKTNDIKSHIINISIGYEF